MADLVQIRQSIAAQVAANTIPALSTSAELLDSVNPPMFLVVPGSPIAKFDVCLGEGILAPDGRPMAPSEFKLRGLLVVGRGDITPNTQDYLDQWLGFQRTATSVSIGMAISMDPTLGGTVEWCEACTEDNYGPIEWSGTTYFGARLLLEVSSR